MFENDTYNYKGWMTSDYFWKRAFGALLYQGAATLLVWVVVVIFVIILAILAAFAFGLTAA